MNATAKPLSLMNVTGRGAINTWECDQWGHMNVQFYLAKLSDSLAVTALQLGLPPSRLRSSPHRLLPVADRVLFKRELRAGDTVVVHAGIRAIAPDGALWVASRMFNADTGVEAAAFETQLRWASLDGLHRLPWPDDVLAAATAAARSGVEAPAPRPMAHSLPVAPDLERLLLTYRGSVESCECDAAGVATTRTHIARFNDATTHVFRALKIDRGALHASGLGSAALDYDIDYRQPMRSGQAVEMRSGLLDAGDKVYHVAHYLIDSDSGEILMTILAAALFFDLAARKSVAIPDAVRREMARLSGGAVLG